MKLAPVRSATQSVRVLKSVVSPQPQFRWDRSP